MGLSRFRVCSTFVFVGKNKQNRQFFKEKSQTDSYSIRQDFDTSKTRFGFGFNKQLAQKHDVFVEFFTNINGVMNVEQTLRLIAPPRET